MGTHDSPSVKPRQICNDDGIVFLRLAELKAVVSEGNVSKRTLFRADLGRAGESYNKLLWADGPRKCDAAYPV